MAKKKANKEVLIKPNDTPVTLSHLTEFKKLVSAENTTIKLSIKSLSRKMDSKFNDVGSKFKDIDLRFDAIDSRFKEIDLRFNAIDSRFKEIDLRFDAIDSRFKEIDERFNSLEVKIENKIDAATKYLEAKIDLGFAKSHEYFQKFVLLAEEQNSKINYVFDHHNMVYERLTKHEVETEKSFKQITQFIELSIKELKANQ
jgi:hypothetical protein